MEPTTLLAQTLTGGLRQVVSKLREKGILNPALEPLTGTLKKWV